LEPSEVTRVRISAGLEVLKKLFEESSMEVIVAKWNDVKDRDESSLPYSYGALRKDHLRLQRTLLKDQAALAHLFAGLNSMDTDLLHLISWDAWATICETCREDPLAGRFMKISFYLGY
jgi:hypothetical protein